MANARSAVTGFPLGIEISIVLHVVVIAIIWAVLHFHGRGMALPAVNNPFDHAIAVSVVPVPKPQPKPKVIPVPSPPKPTPTPAVVQTQSVQPQQQTPPPDVKTPPQPQQQQQEEQTEDQANPDYQQVVMNMLQQAKQYPRQAILTGDEGAVNITFILNAQGTVLGYTIEKPSGHEELDAEVRRLVHAVHFPPFPADYHGSRMTLNVTIDFHLGEQAGH